MKNNPRFGSNRSKRRQNVCESRDLPWRWSNLTHHMSRCRTSVLTSERSLQQTRQHQMMRYK